MADQSLPVASPTRVVIPQTPIEPRSNLRSEKDTIAYEESSSSSSEFSLAHLDLDLEKAHTRAESVVVDREVQLLRSITRQDIQDVESMAHNKPQSVGDDTNKEDSSKIVTWDGDDDPERPMNMPQWRKWAIVVSTGLMTFCVSFGSSVFTTTTAVTAKKFHVSSEVTLLGLSLYVLGFAIAPLVWGPLSEVYGRTRPLWIGMAGFMIFQIPTAVAQNLQTIFLSRFLAGGFGAAPLAIVGGIFVDFLPAAERGVATSIFSGSVLAGPAIGPIVGSFITYSHLGWRWTSWITLIMTAVFAVPCFLLLPETFEPTLLRRRAQRLRLETHDWALHAKAEEHALDFRSLVSRHLSKPLVMIAREPILMVLTFYISLVYGILYLTFEAFPISFMGDRHWTPQHASLPFLSVLVGTVIASTTTATLSKVTYARIVAAGHRHPTPEDRIPVMALGSVILPLGLFLFAWTSARTIHPAPQILAGVFIGAGIVFIFQGVIVYMVDVYLLHANSALAVNTFVRSLFGAAFPMFATYMYHGLGVDWATTVLAFVCVALIPFPWVLWRYGARIRALSRFAFTL